MFLKLTKISFKIELQRFPFLTFTDSDECSTDPCGDNGSCVDQVNSFVCICDDGYDGDNCETDSDDCDPNPCLNGSSCTDAVNGFSCSCADGYEGDTCGTGENDSVGCGFCFLC